MAKLDRQLDVSVATLRSYIEQGRLQALRVGRSYRVTEEALKAFLQASSSTPGAGWPWRIARTRRTHGCSSTIVSSGRGMAMR